MGYVTFAPTEKKPSYIPSNLFSNALLSELRKLATTATASAPPPSAPLPPAATNPVIPAHLATPASSETGQVDVELDTLNSLINSMSDDNFKKTLQEFVRQAQGDFQNLITSIEKWYDAKMERVSGVYKRWIQTWLLVISFFLAAILNLDTIQIVNGLWTNDVLRHTLADNAVNSLPKSDANADPTKTIQSYKNLLDDQQKAGLPIGWGSDFWANFKNSDKDKELDGLKIIGKLLGWIITMFALSLGAPFWFDLLNKITNLRSVGERPATTAPPDNSRS